MTKYLHILAALLLTLSPLSARSSAQETDPQQILQDSAAALAAVPGFSAKVTLSGEGSQMILSTLPSMTARLTMGTHPESGKALHMLGELRATEKAAPESFDIVYSQDKYIWADHAKSTINIRPPSVSARLRPTVFSYLLLAELIKDNPFQKELDTAESLELEPQQTIADALCNVVLITRAKPAKGARPTGAHTKERWFIGAQDNLPRRVEQITDAGMIKATLIMELSGLNIAPQSDADLDVFRPETYKVSDTTKRAPQSQAPNNKIKTPTLPDRDQPFTKPTQPQTPTNPPAPNYTFTDTTGTEISRNSQAGRITVLYFFGSWSIPSKQTTPLLSTLANDYISQPNPNTPVDTFAIALRESDPTTVTQAHRNNTYAHRLTINPLKTLPNLFQIRVYPTIIVIDDNNRIIYKEHLTPDRNAQALIDETKAAITKALAP